MTGLDPARRLERQPTQGPPTEPAAFVRWAEGREGRFELSDGQITMMVGATIRHELVVSNLVVLLRAQLTLPRFAVIPGGLAVAVAGGIRYPDVTVHEGAFDPADLVARRPVLVAEVLSPSSLTTDMLHKPTEYGAVASIGAYLLLAQEEPRAWFWRRGAEGFPHTPEEFFGPDAGIALPPLGLELRLADIHAGLPGV
jgi:Uma2 family endonuclease